MKKVMSISSVVLVLVASFSSVMLADVPGKTEQTLETRIGELTFENSFEYGIPTAETVKHLFNTID